MEVASPLTTSTHNYPVSLDLSREESWVAHAAVLAALTRAAEQHADDTELVSALESLEADAPFTRGELQRLRDALDAYRERVPDRDREASASALDAVDSALANP